MLIVGWALICVTAGDVENVFGDDLREVSEGVEPVDVLAFLFLVGRTWDRDEVSKNQYTRRPTQKMRTWSG